MTDPKLVEAVARAIAGEASLDRMEKQTDFYADCARAALSAINATGTHWVLPAMETMQAIEPEIEVWDAEIDEPIRRTMFEAIAYTLCGQAGMTDDEAKAWVAAMRTAYLAKPDEEETPNGL